MLQVEKSDKRNHWAVILAGGDGTRLKSLTRRISGDERPKQFCPVLGGVSLLEETQRRIAHEFATEQTLYVVNRRHAEYYQPLLRNVTADNLVAQPANRGTAPAILYSLLRIAVRDPNAVVTFFPSDHFISDDRMFMRHVRSAIDAARRRPDLIVLLGIEPESPEVEYGWIEPGIGIPEQGEVFGVRRFWEKPNKVLAQVLQLRGCLWNSFVMTASVKALLVCIERSAPELFRSFSCVLPVLGTGAESRTVEYVYQHLQEVNFSQQVLAHLPGQLAVIRVTGVHWSDLGEPKRVLASLDMAGVRPHWADGAVPQFA
jgi:mannose-1-phosphate guanylyltransferase